MDDQTLISCLSLHLSRFQRRSGQQSMLSYVIKNVIVYIVIFSEKKMKMAIIGTFPSIYTCWPTVVCTYTCITTNLVDKSWCTWPYNTHYTQSGKKIIFWMDYA